MTLEELEDSQGKEFYFTLNKTVGHAFAGSSNLSLLFGISRGLTLCLASNVLTERFVFDKSWLHIDPALPRTKFSTGRPRPASTLRSPLRKRHWRISRCSRSELSSIANIGLFDLMLLISRKINKRPQGRISLRPM